MATPKKITLADGTVRYRVVYDAGRDPVTNKRRQLCRTFDRLKDATAELNRVGHERDKGTYVAPSKLTLNGMLDGWLKSATFEKEAATSSNYGHALKPARERLGERLVQSVTRADVEGLRDWMLTQGRKRGGTPGTGLGARSVRLTLSRLSAAFNDALDEGLVTRNPCARVRLPRQVRPVKVTWSVEEARAFLAAAAADRLHVAWLLAMCGLRREEVCGLKWLDVDLEAGTLTVAIVRVVVDGKVIVKAAPKSQRSARTLPLLDGMAAAFKGLRKRQLEERLAAGEAYGDSGYVVTDELGAAVHPEWFSDEFERVAARAGVTRMTPHGARHTANSLMEKAGVPRSIRAAWCGHTEDVNEGTYTHARPDDLAVARDTLSQLYGGER